MIGIEFLVSFWIIIGSLILLCYHFPAFGGCIILLILGVNLYSIVADRREANREQGIKDEVEVKYPEMSDHYKDRIVRSVMKGADINDFTIEDGWLKRGQDDKAKYANSMGQWGSKESYLDRHPLYAEETQALKAQYSQFKHLRCRDSRAGFARLLQLGDLGDGGVLRPARCVAEQAWCRCPQALQSPGQSLMATSGPKA